MDALCMRWDALAYSVVASNILKKVLDDGHRDDEPDVLRPLETLESNPNHLRV